MRGTGRVIDAGLGQSTSLADSVIITLQPGWNDIGHPFAFTVPRSLVRVPGSVDGPYAYEGSWQSPGGVTQLEPWKGYAFRNLGSSPTTIAIPPRMSALPIAPSPESERGAWYARLEARCGEALDDDNVVGWSEHATDGKDVFDYSEPPPVGDFVSLRFPADGGSSTADAWTSDIRALPRDGQRWPIVVETRITGAPVRLSWSGFESLPSGLEAAVLDPVEGIAIDPRRQASYEYENAARRELALLVGTPEFVRAGSRPITVPAGFALAPAAPNPFRLTAGIRYQLPTAVHVSAKVYDPPGREVRTLVDGLRDAGHRASWDGRDTAGRALSDGVYFVRMGAGAFQATRKIVLAH